MTATERSHSAMRQWPAAHRVQPEIQATAFLKFFDKYLIGTPMSFEQ
jgi:hypothetical protein